MKIKNILLAYDGSNESKRALKYAEYLAVTYNSDIKAVYFNNIINASVTAYPYYVVFLEKFAEKENREYEKVFKKIKKRLELKNINFDYHVENGEPVKKILDYAKKNDVDLIIMGITGRGLIGNLLIGRTSLKILNRTKLPVFAVSAKKRSIPVEDILLPVDIYEPNYKALDYALDICSKTSCKLTVAYVMQIGSGMNDFPDEIKNKIISDVNRDFDKFISEIKELFRKIGSSNELSVNKEILYGLNAGLAIINHCKDKKYDLIVMNTHGRKGLKKFLMGSVASNIIGGSQCSVLILKDE